MSLKVKNTAAKEASVRFVRYKIQIYRSHNMLCHGAQKVELPNSFKILRLLSPLAIFPRFQDFQRYMISGVAFWWKAVLFFGHFAATL